MTDSVDKYIKIIKEKKLEIHSYDQGKLVEISARPSVACSARHNDHDDCTPTF
jgi:hypothetical protein